MTENYILKIKNKKFYLFNEFKSLVGIGNSYKLAREDLEKKILNAKKVNREIGFDFNKINTNMEISSNKLSYFKKWCISLIFVTLMSIILSYSISNGIKNALNSLDFPRGNKIWNKIGDEIIKVGKSDTLNNNEREDEINDSLLKIKKRINPYIKIFFSDEDCK